jgi:hypothetical protein
MENETLTKKIGLNECSSCKSWNVHYSKSKSQILDISLSDGKSGLCLGGGFDGFQTQSDETCSMWKPLLDKERILPIFHDGGNDY